MKEIVKNMLTRLTCFHWVLKGCFNKLNSSVFINLHAVLIILAKLATLGILKKLVLWNKDYDVITYTHDITRITSSDLDYIVEMVIWPKSCYSSISIGEAITTYECLTSENIFWGVILVKIQ